MPVAEAVLEDRRDALAGFLLRLGERVGLGQRTDERLLEDDVAAGGEHLHGLLEMQVRGRGDVDDVEIARRAGRRTASKELAMPYSPHTAAARAASMSQKASTS